MNLEQLELALPKSKKGQVNQELVDLINEAETRGDFEGFLEDNIISYQSILQDGRYKIQDYIKAIEYGSYYLNGDEQAESFVKTFPDKVKRRVMEGKTSYATGAPAMYHRGQLVQAVLAQMQIPTEFLHHHKLDHAIEKQYTLMMDPTTTDRIQMECASSLMAFFKKDETKKIEVEIGVKKDDSAIAFEKKMLQMAELQQEAFVAGSSIKTLQKIEFEDAEVVEDEQEFTT